jgi:hypothetical protein
VSRNGRLPAKDGGFVWVYILCDVHVRRWRV